MTQSGLYLLRLDKWTVYVSRYNVVPADIKLDDILMLNVSAAQQFSACIKGNHPFDLCCHLISTRASPAES